MRIAKLDEAQSAQGIGCDYDAWLLWILGSVLSAAEGLIENSSGSVSALLVVSRLVELDIRSSRRRIVGARDAFALREVGGFVDA